MRFRSPTGPPKFSKGLTIGILRKTKNGYISLFLAGNEKNKSTFFSPTFEVEGNKVILFLSQVRAAHLASESWFVKFCPDVQMFGCGSHFYQPLIGQVFRNLSNTTKELLLLIAVHLFTGLEIKCNTIKKIT